MPILPIDRTALALAAALLLAACSGAREPDAPEPRAQAPAAQPPAAQAPASAGRQQPASPRDTAEMRFGNDVIRVDYGRPYMRGRKIMGELVPYGRVWRTGANAATTLITTRDLRIGDVRVPEGTYTLYTLPGEGEWQLIINRQTGQWGTEYDQAQDLARIPMRVERLEQPVEQFTIDFEPGSGNVFNLNLRWENTRAWVRGQVVHPGAAH